jgi:S1-C subfamily serine protease
MGLKSNKLVIGSIPIVLGSIVGWLVNQQLVAETQSSTTSNSQLPQSTPAVPVVFAPVKAAKSLPIAPDDLNFIATAVKSAGPAVVRIDASSESQIDRTEEPDRTENTPDRGTGSGFILTADGKILTNAHVVEGSKKVQVTLKDNVHLEGEVIGVDRLTDLAVIQVNRRNLPTISVGDSNRLRPGEWAIAIGNPLGLDNSVTVGIVSAIGRTSSQVGISDKRVRFIQTDAAINPGNSGGPLLNARGEAIGINTAIRSNGQGLGFAIPIHSAIDIAERLIAKGKIDRPYLGVEMIAITPELLAGIAKEPSLRSKVKAQRGALIMKVVPSSPADTAGIRPGDAIVKVANRPVEHPSDVQQQVDASPIGKNLQLEISREGKLESVSIVPSVFPELDIELETGRN